MSFQGMQQMYSVIVLFIHCFYSFSLYVIIKKVKKKIKAWNPHTANDKTQSEVFNNVEAKQHILKMKH